MKRKPQDVIEEIEEEYNYVESPAWTEDEVAAPPVTSESNAKLTAETQQLETRMQHLNSTLLAAHENMARYCNDLTVQFDLLTHNYTALESKRKDLTAVNQQLETQRNNLTEQIQDLETNWNKLNVSRAQWSIDAYCPKDKDN
ncbi:hypothetical protein FQN60_017328, partial [Etheostoma spectabile]